VVSARSSAASAVNHLKWCLAAKARKQPVQRMARSGSVEVVPLGGGRDHSDMWASKCGATAIARDGSGLGDSMHGRRPFSAPSRALLPHPLPFQIQVN